MTAKRVLTVDQARAFYDRMGAWQDWQPFYEDTPLRVLLQAAKFQAAHSFIEFGCGTGRFSLQILSEITPADCCYFGVDLSSTDWQHSPERAFAAIPTEQKCACPMEK